ncbi:MAG: alkaline phosphatase family protein [Candidatus Omnitrophota bacterium]
MSNHLIIFIDGFPYELIKKLDFLNRFSYKCGLMPSIGYSINIQAEIFAGLKADQIDFFNTWKFEPKSSPFKRLKNIKWALGTFQDNRYLSWFFRKAIKFNYRADSLNIPYRFIDMFAPCGYSIYSGNLTESRVLPDETFLELDTVAHKFGLDSKEYNDSINCLNKRINNLFDRFRLMNPNGHIVALSDHGMSRVQKAVQLDLEKEISLSADGNFMYFLDTTMLRVWYVNQKAKLIIETFLNSRDYGRLLNEEERISFGIANKKWADSIFLLNEGYVFDPSFLEKGHPKAMHGYYPHLPWQKGIFLYSGPKFFTVKDVLTTAECYAMLKEIVNVED